MAGDNPLGGILKGYGKGMAKGAALGANPALMAATGGLSVAIGAGAGALLGGGTAAAQSIQAKKAKEKADGLMPSLYDPMQLAMLAEIQQKRKSLLSGSAYAGQMNAIDQSTAGTNRAIVQAMGGDVGGALQGLLQAQSGAARAKNQVLGQAGQQEQFYTTLGADFANQVSNRALQLQMAGMSQARAEWAQSAQDAYANAANAASRMDANALLDVLKGVTNAERGSSMPSLPSTTQTPEQAARALNPIQSVISPMAVDDVSIQDNLLFSAIK